MKHQFVRSTPIICPGRCCMSSFSWQISSSSQGRLSMNVTRANTNTHPLAKMLIRQFEYHLGAKESAFFPDLSSSHCPASLKSQTCRLTWLTWLTCGVTNLSRGFFFFCQIRRHDIDYCRLMQVAFGRQSDSWISNPNIPSHAARLWHSRSTSVVPGHPFGWEAPVLPES